MKKEVVQTTKAPAAIGPYVQAVKANGFLFVSGQLGFDLATGEIPEAVADQTRFSLANLGAILAEAGLDPAAVVKTTIFLTNMDDFAVVNQIYGDFFEGNFPARSTVAVRTLPKAAKVEIECIAVLN